MKKSGAFTLLEVTIALSLSCVVVFGMLQAYRNLVAYLDKVHDILSINRQVCLLCNQMERDFNTAFIPPLYKDVKKEEEPKKLKGQEKEAQELELLKNYFQASCDEQEIQRHEGKTVYPFKTVAMINTNPLQVYGQRRVRLVRVMYELVLDKEKSKSGLEGYQLWRKETTDIDNIKMKINELAGPTEKEKAHPIRTHLVASGIKKFYVEYSLKKKTEETHFFSWGNNKETMGVVPQRIDMFIEFWNAQQTQSYPFRASFVVLPYAMKPSEKQDASEAPADDKNKVEQPTIQKQPEITPVKGELP